MRLKRHPRSKYLHAVWKDSSGKEFSRSTKTTDRKLAKQRGLAFAREHDAAAARLPTHTQTLDAAIRGLIDHKRRMKRSAATHEITACKTGHLLRLFGEAFDINALTLAQPSDDPILHSTERYLDVRREEGASDLTISKEVGNLLQACRVARAQTPPLFHRDPKVLWPKALDGAYEPQDTYWTLEEYQTAMAHMVASRRDHVTLYCATGVRLSELYVIEARHIDELNRRAWVDGRKTKGAKRWVPLDVDAFEVLTRRAKLYPNGPLFPDRWSRSRLCQDMKKVAKRAKVPVVSANDFRRTFATWCADAGVDEGTCYRWMGHTSGLMIRRVYQQLSDRRAAKQGALLSAFKQAIVTADGEAAEKPA